MLSFMGKTNTTDRSNEEWTDTCRRYLATYGAAGLRGMASTYRTDRAHRVKGGRLLPLRYSTAAAVLASLADVGMVSL